MKPSYDIEYGQEAHPGICKHKKKDSGYNEEESASVLFSCYPFYETEQYLDNCLRKVLQPFGDELHLACGEEEEDYQHQNAAPRRDKGVGDVDGSQLIKWFGGMTAVVG